MNIKVKHQAFITKTEMLNILTNAVAAHSGKNYRVEGFEFLLCAATESGYVLTLIPPTNSNLESVAAKDEN